MRYVLSSLSAHSRETITYRGGEILIFERVEALCKEKGISVRQLEQECHIGNGIIARWKNSSPRAANLYKVAKYFGVPMEYLLAGDECEVVCGAETKAE